MADAHGDEDYAPNVHGKWLAESGAAHAMVNVVFPLKVVDSQGGETRYFGLAHWILPRVPTIGEEIRALEHHATVERVLWSSDAKVTIRLREARTTVNGLTALETEGWSVEPWEDEPPSEWFETS